MSMRYDLAVIGAGSAGVSAAVQAAKLQHRVCLLDNQIDSIGGAWIQTGTLPSKTLREVLTITNSVRVHADKQQSEAIVKHMLQGRIFTRAKQVSHQQMLHVLRYLAKNGIVLFSGKAKILNNNTIALTNKDNFCSEIKANKILIATGTRPRRPADIPFDGKRVLDADEILQLYNAPRRILIYGAGFIGCEYACIFSALGVETILADARPQIMPDIDQEIAHELQEAMRSLGVEFRLGENLRKIQPKEFHVEVSLERSFLQTNIFFFAAGRLPNTSALWDDETLNIETRKKGLIKVSADFQTSVEGIYAAGDIIGLPALAATSSHQGRLAASNALGLPSVSFPSTYPIGVYTIPELSSIGATQEELDAANVAYVVGRAGYGEIARGFIRGDTHGKLKLLVCKETHRLLGVHIVGEGACELIHIGMLLMQAAKPVEELVHVVYNYPTLAEGYRIAAFNALNKLFPDGLIGQPSN